MAVSRERFEGYKQALLEADMEVSDELLINEQYIKKNTKLPNGADALFTESFIYFEDFFKRFLGESKDIALGGFDDPQFSSGYFLGMNFPFVRQRAELMGKTAAELLLKQIGGDRNFVSSFIKPELSWEDNA
jgi:DNA-binding LacI/PurR family transcriptional regulator